MPIIVDIAGDWEADALVTLQTVRYLLYVENPTSTHTDDDLLNILISGCSIAFEKYCDRTFTQAAYTEYHDGEGDNTVLRVKNPPIASSPAPTLNVDGDYSWGSDTAYTIEDDWYYDADTGIIKLHYGAFPEGLNIIKVTYTGGYSSIPDDVQLAVGKWVCREYKIAKDSRYGLTGESHGEYAINFTQDEIPSFGRKVGNLYRLKSK